MLGKAEKIPAQPQTEMNHVNASLPAVFIATAFRASAVLAIMSGALPLQADSFAVVPLLPTGITSGPRPPLLLDHGSRGNRNIERASERAAAAARAKAKDAELSSPTRFAFFCFGPVFGNASREIDPNFMPPPTDSRTAEALPEKTVHYTRVPANAPGKAMWVGSNGSRITYVAKSADAQLRNEPAAASVATTEQSSVEDLIAENRKELTKISWARAFRRYPELERQESPERAAFDQYLAENLSALRAEAAFDNPMWPELVASQFAEHRKWREAEQESWDRVRAKVRVFNDPNSTYTRRFMEFAAGLRADPEGAVIFTEPTWPEKALELHDQQLGVVPQ